MYERKQRSLPPACASAQATTQPARHAETCASSGGAEGRGATRIPISFEGVQELEQKGFYPYGAQLGVEEFSSQTDFRHGQRGVSPIADTHVLEARRGQWLK